MDRIIFSLNYFDIIFVPPIFHGDINIGYQRYLEYRCSKAWYNKVSISWDLIENFNVSNGEKDRRDQVAVDPFPEYKDHIYLNYMYRVVVITVAQLNFILVQDNIARKHKR